MISSPSKWSQMTKQGLLKLVVEIWTIYQIGLWTPFTPSQNYGHLSQQHKIMDTFTASQNYGHLSQHHKIMDTFHSIIKTNNIQACPIPAAGERKLIQFVWLQCSVKVTRGCEMRHRTSGSTTQKLCQCAQEYSNIALKPLHTAGSKIMSHQYGKTNVLLRICIKLSLWIRRACMCLMTVIMFCNMSRRHRKGIEV